MSQQVRLCANLLWSNLVRDLHHPSLHAKKYDERKDTWQARVNRDWRFYFRIEGDTYLMIREGKYPPEVLHAPLCR